VLETAKQIVGTPSGLRKIRKWTLWRGRPPPKRKKEFVYGVRAGQCGRTGHSMSNSPTFVCERERKKKTLDDRIGKREEKKKIICMIVLEERVEKKKTVR
jgi:hypothetical protein